MRATSALRPSDTAYPEINALFVRIIRETGARPEYLWGSLHGAHLAKALGIEEVSLIEFGVAGGNGLVALDGIAQAIETNVGVRARVFGFDTGRGLPPPVDWRDCPNFYSSTVEALRIFEVNADVLLPRVHCYFDDITGFTYADFNGERLAILEFNERASLRKISSFFGLRHYVPSRCAADLWVEKMHLAHVLDHPLYGKPDGLVRVARKDLP